VGPGHGVFENVFVMPQRESPMTRMMSSEFITRAATL
jgi:hypothetical protein